ncbi:flagellin [Gelria sp. Kuro-4]|uniref:flagellin N-terminal helical domain-containing protein n=1 Tax=Gelria sp. Kuro-4 TaxID=2796927 RepID=UPI001BF0F125|nr:flagellin [Gelria sp. Kuro-4]BCV25494.1 flagellin [Gelria sp. Kuro-4]
MGLRINANLEALNAWRNLTVTSTNLSKAMEKLSSGLRINRAGDDAAGLAISEKLRAQVRGLNQAVRNAQDGISLIQTAEGALTETHSILQRMRELAVQAANDTLTTADRNAIQTEVDKLLEEIDRIAKTTQFNAQLLLDGGTLATTGLNLQIGANAGQNINVKISAADTAAMTISGISVADAAAASAAIASLDSAINYVSIQRANLGAVQNRLEHTIANLSVASENLTASESRIRDADMAQEMMNFTKTQILQQAGVAMLAQANMAPQAVLQLLR